MTSEQRRDLALMWHSKGVPMEDITRLLHISEQEARDIITGTPQAGEAVSQREREVTAAKAALTALLAGQNHNGAANGSTGTVGGVHGGSTVIGAANKGLYAKRCVSNLS